MLTKDLLRYRQAGDRIEPTWLAPTLSVRELAGELIAFWQAGVGQRRGELEDASLPLLHRSRSLVVARGLEKLVLDRCTFSDPSDAADLRERAFAASAALLHTPAANAEAHRQAVAATLNLDSTALGEALYADLPDYATLAAGPAINAEALIGAYNIELAQGLLLGARELVVTVHDADTGLRRKLLKALRWRRLLARITGDDGNTLQLTIGGPADVLDQATRYGLQLAQWLPALACCRRWEANAALTLDHGKVMGTLRLDHTLKLAGDSAFLGHVPEELTALDAALRKANPTWRIEEPGLLPLADGEIVVPDLAIGVGPHTVRIELFHRWHALALARRLQQVAALPTSALVLGVDRALARTTAIAPLINSVSFTARGFLFSDIPTPRALREVIDRVVPT